MVYHVAVVPGLGTYTNRLRNANGVGPRVADRDQTTLCVEPVR